MTDSASISDDDIAREGAPIEEVENLDIGLLEDRDTGDESDGPTEDDENLDMSGDGPRDTGDR
jgi:hypothetical protein